MALFGALAEAVRRGEEVFRGSVAVTGSVAVGTPFKTIAAVIVTQRRGTAPGLNSSVYTHTISGKTVTIFAWKSTSATDPTLIAGTVSSTVDYIIIGKRR